MTSSMIQRTGVHLIVAAAVLFSILPLAWILLLALKSPADAFAIPPKWLFQPVWDNFPRAWQSADFSRAFSNSIIVCVGGNILSLAAAIPAAYALNKFRMPGKSVFLVSLLLFYMLPEFLIIIPMYIFYQSIGLFDTQLGLILAYQVFSLPFSIWLLRGFFAEIPEEIAEAALLDGCSTFRLLTRIYIPLCAPGIAATAILNSMRMWNELTFALALTFRDAQTTTLAVASFRGYGSIDWGAMAAGASISTLPMALLALVAQRWIVRGLTLGAVK